jgi:predicted DNA-binding transcriptional regulator AlpA
MRNQDIRNQMKSSRIYYNEVSDRLGIHESSFYRLLRTNLTSEQKEQIFSVINDLKKEKYELLIFPN